MGAAPDNDAHSRKPPRVTRRIDPCTLRLRVAAVRAGLIVRALGLNRANRGRLARRLGLQMAAAVTAVERMCA